MTLIVQRNYDDKTSFDKAFFIKNLCTTPLN